MINMSTTRFTLITMVLCTAPVMLFAQQSNIETLLRGCTSIEDDGQRLSCYDQILVPDKLTERTEPSVKADSGDKSEAVLLPQSQAEVAETKEVAEAKPVADEEFGLKQKQPRESVNITPTVNGIRKNLAGHFVYTTTDGQVWVQIDSRKPRYDEVPFVAEIRTASLGSFFLKPKTYGFSVRVRREK